jgi:hypothetical protein
MFPHALQLEVAGAFLVSPAVARRMVDEADEPAPWLYHETELEKAGSPVGEMVQCQRAQHHFESLIGGKAERLTQFGFDNRGVGAAPPLPELQQLWRSNPTP